MICSSVYLLFSIVSSLASITRELQLPLVEFSGGRSIQSPRLSTTLRSRKNDWVRTDLVSRDDIQILRRYQFPVCVLDLNTTQWLTTPLVYNLKAFLFRFEEVILAPLA